MSLLKTKHLKYEKNLLGRFCKVGIRYEASWNRSINLEQKVWLSNANGVPYWERIKDNPKWTGFLRIRVKSKGRGRPSVFQKYISPHIGE